MTIYQQGALNTSALTVPGLYLVVNSPPVYLNGVASGVLGLVGTASWGPSNKAIPVGQLKDYYASFGPVAGGTADLGVAVSTAIRMGVASIRCVRVTNGTEVAATGTDTGPDGTSYVARYRGSAGNNIAVSFTAPTAPATLGTLNVSHPQLGAFSYSGTNWTDIANAANADTSGLVTVTVGASPKFTSFSAFHLAGGTDTGVPPDALLLGTDAGIGATGTGMYALRNAGCSHGVILGAYDSAIWSGQIAFATSEGVYMVGCTKPGDTISNAISTKATAGVDSPWFKLQFGDWGYTTDPLIGNTMLPPSLFAAAELASRAPNYPALNSDMEIITATQRSLASSAASTAYSYAELQALVAAGIDVIGNPSPGGAYFSCLTGHNTSSTATTQSDTYPAMTSYIARTLNAGMGLYVGQPIDALLLREIETTLVAFMTSMRQAGLISDLSDGTPPFQIVCDSTNNPQSRTALGYVQADVAVRYQGVNEKFIINLQGGSSVTISAGS